MVFGIQGLEDLFNKTVLHVAIYHFLHQNTKTKPRVFFFFSPFSPKHSVVISISFFLLEYIFKQTFIAAAVVDGTKRFQESFLLRMQLADPDRKGSC